MRTILSAIILTALMGGFLLGKPVHAQEAFLAFACQDRDHVEALASEMTERNVQQSDPRWFTCRPIGVGISDMTGAPVPFLGPLVDWEGDPFALYEQGGVFLIVYWVNGYRPAGMRV